MCRNLRDGFCEQHCLHDGFGNKFRTERPNCIDVTMLCARPDGERNIAVTRRMRRNDGTCETVVSHCCDNRRLRLREIRVRRDYR